MTTITRNEAAERLLPGDSYCERHSRCGGVDPFRHPNQRTVTLDEVLAAERRATVERFILAMKDGELPGSTAQEKAGIQYAALWLAKTFRDEEAAR
jgi:hypothetical protein